nr:uncharacterized protein LOC127306971 [Lolium perenne]
MAPALPPRGCRAAPAPPHWRGAAGPHLVHLTGARPHRRGRSWMPLARVRPAPPASSLLGYVLTSGTDYRRRFGNSHSGCRMSFSSTSSANVVVGLLVLPAAELSGCPTVDLPTRMRRDDPGHLQQVAI